MNKQENTGIWHFQNLLPFVSPNCRLTLGEGATPFVHIDSIFFKCEYANPTGSVKDRGIVYQVSKILESGIKTAVISSSGNAAISASVYCSLAKINLHVFVASAINKMKLVKLKENYCQIHISDRPVSSAVRFAQDVHAYNLRQSTDPNGTFGCETIAYEIIEKEKGIDAVFFPVSSGTTVVGVANGFIKNDKLPAIHLVQTERIHPIAALFDKEFQEKSTSLADAIVAKYTIRQDEVVKLVKKSHGFGWVIKDNDLEKARGWLLGHSLDCSYEGAATLAALWKAQKKGYVYKKPVCLLTGRYYL